MTEPSERPPFERADQVESPPPLRFKVVYVRHHKTLDIGFSDAEFSRPEFDFDMALELLQAKVDAAYAQALKDDLAAAAEEAQRAEAHPETTRPPPSPPPSANIAWQQGTGTKGPYEYAPYGPATDALVEKIRNETKPRAFGTGFGGYFYWLGDDRVFRRKQERKSP